MQSDVDPLLDAYAQVLRTHRRARGLSQEELGHEAGLSLRYVSLLENRVHQPSLKTAKALATALGLTLAEMISEAEALM